MKDHEKHVLDTRTSNNKGLKLSYCGKDISMEFHFQDAEHCLNTIKSGSYLLPCPKCKQRIIEIITIEP